MKVVFTGWVQDQDCLGQPEFPELGLKGDMSSGQVVFPLELSTYTFTCSMGVNEQDHRSDHAWARRAPQTVTRSSSR